MTKINTVTDEETFHPADNPITQYKDSLIVKRKHKTIKDLEDLETILNESLFRLSVEEFVSFVKFDPLFKRIKDEDIYSSMLLVSLFSQLSYSTSCLPTVNYDPHTWVKPSKTKLVKNTLTNLSSSITQLRPKYFDNFGYAHTTCMFDTFSANMGHYGLTVEQTRQVMEFYIKHYHQINFGLFNERNRFIKSISKTEDLNYQTLEKETRYQLKIEYAVESKKLPITVHYQLQDCAIKTLKFVHKFKNAQKSIYFNIVDDFLDNLVELYDTNWNNAKLRKPVSINSILCSIQNKNSQYMYPKSAIQSASIRNHLLDSLIKIAGQKH